MPLGRSAAQRGPFMTKAFPRARRRRLDRAAPADDARKVNLRRARSRPESADAHRQEPSGRTAAPFGNSFGLLEAMLGIVGGFLLTFVAVSVYVALTRHPRHPSQYGEDVVSLLALWTGFVGAAVLATRLAVRRPASSLPAAAVATRPGRRGTGSVVRDYGLALRPWPDVPLGIAVGVASQYLLVPVVEAPLVPFVHHLYYAARSPGAEPHQPRLRTGSRRARRPRLRREPDRRGALLPRPAAPGARRHLRGARAARGTRPSPSS